MKPGLDARRRNRNIGTAKQGHGQDNRLVISKSRYLYSALDKIGDYAKIQRTIQGISINFIVETTRNECIHPCSVDDVTNILGMVPLSDWVGIGTIVFRQPTRKQAILNPAWGRLRYSGEVKSAPDRIIASGPMIILDAIDESSTIQWTSSLDCKDQLELDRLRSDGHLIERVGRSHRFRLTVQSSRNTQLYRTFLHEIGHWFDWLGRVEEPAQRGVDYNKLIEEYFARPAAEREVSAHRYADSMRRQLIDQGRIPFDPIPTPSSANTDSV